MENIKRKKIDEPSSVDGLQSITTESNHIRKLGEAKMTFSCLPLLVMCVTVGTRQIVAYVIKLKNEECR